MDIIETKYIELLNICMEKKMSVDTLIQLMNLIHFPKTIEIANSLEKKIKKITERQLREEIAMIIKKQTKEHRV